MAKGVVVETAAAEANRGPVGAESLREVVAPFTIVPAGLQIREHLIFRARCDLGDVVEEADPNQFRMQWHLPARLPVLELPSVLVGDVEKPNTFRPNFDTIVGRAV
jgi:hypothetical protein